MKSLYDVTITICSENSPTASLILPLLTKILTQFTPTPFDSSYAKSLKKAVYGDLENRYQDPVVRSFLEEATDMDPRTKQKNCVPPETWNRLETAMTQLIEEVDKPVIKVEPELSLSFQQEESSQERVNKKCLLDQILGDDDDNICVTDVYKLTPQEMAEKEICMYSSLHKMPSFGDPLEF